MEHHRTLKITLHYANDLHRVNLFSKMDVYALVSISGGDNRPTQETKSPSDPAGGRNPSWGFPMKFTVEEAAMHQNRIFLDFKLVCKRALGDRDVGEAHVPIKELLDSSASKGRPGGKKFVSYQVRKPSGKPKGHLTFSYQFVGKTATAADVPPVHGRAVEGCLPPPSWFYPLMMVAAERERGGYYLPPIDCSLAASPTLRMCYLPAVGGCPPATSGCGYHPMPAAVTPPPALPLAAPTTTSSTVDLDATAVTPRALPLAAPTTTSSTVDLDATAVTPPALPQAAPTTTSSTVDLDAK